MAALAGCQAVPKWAVFDLGANPRTSNERRKAVRKENPLSLTDRNVTHTIVVADNDVGTGVEDGKGNIRLWLSPPFVLNGWDSLDIKLVPRAQRKRRTKRASR